MNEFITWEMLGDFVKLTSIVFTTTQFTKNLPFIKNIKTIYWAWIIAFILIIVTNANTNNFAITDILLYGLSAIFVSLSASGIHDVGNYTTKKEMSKMATIDNRSAEEIYKAMTDEIKEEKTVREKGE